MTEGTGSMKFLDRVYRRARREWLQWETRGTLRSVSAAAARGAPMPGDDHPVVIFNASTRLGGMSLNAGFALLIAWSLRLAGVPVVHYVCQRGLTRCVLGSNKQDVHALPPCRECLRQSDAAFRQARRRAFEYTEDPSLAQALSDMDLAQLSAVTVEDVPLGSLVLSSLRWILRRHHLEDDLDTRFLFRHYLLSAWSLYRDVERMLAELQPRCLLVFNGMFYPEAVARWAARRRGVKVVSHEVGLQPMSAFFTTGEATAYPIDIPDSFELDPGQSRRLDEYLEERFQGRFSMAGIQFWQEMRALSPEITAKMARFKQVVPVFTNVIFDTSQGHANVLYPHMFAWLDDVLAIIRGEPQTLFVIRAHPDEHRGGKESRESVAAWVRANRVDALENVIFVDSHEYLSSYDLIRRSKFVMVYNSTIGLEAAILGAAVLCGGKARYTQLPTVFFPASAADYRAQARRFLAADAIAVPPAFQRNARRFLYVQLFRTSLPFEDYLVADGVWNGYVSLKDFSLRDLLPERSPTMRVIHEGILGEGDFLLPL
ncbi:MAG: hypothetical protein HPY76_12525 [Anaerolineae bacterium]|nr:hypothetical protein [Anaerolineae bacterium]